MSKLQNKFSDPKPSQKKAQKDQKGSKWFQKLKMQKVRKLKGYTMKPIDLYE